METLAYLIAAVLFILSLRGLSSQESARQGNIFGVLGMFVALVATATLLESGWAFGLLGVVVLSAAGLGGLMAKRVAMTAMPELVALLHSFVGAAAVLVGFSTYLSPPAVDAGAVFRVEVFIDVFIGAITFTGSIVAWLKLQGKVSGSPLLLPGRHLLNAGAVVASIALAVLFAGAEGTSGLWALGTMTLLASLLGVHLVAAIGGADMPVVVSMLNSYSGWTASAAGFMLSNDLLIITGALVGSSGVILSYIMCKAMNRSIWNVIFGGFGTEPSAAPGPSAEQPQGSVQETSADDLVARLQSAKEVIVVPGYGLAVARAQHAVYEMTRLLRSRGCRVRFAIHPVAGRLPGHVNVLLAEANVPYDIVLEMEEINEDMPAADVVLVIGANDIVNPGAQTDASSPIYGMPVLEVWKSLHTVVFKRSRRTGYAGVDNPLFYMEKTRMLFGDARDSLDAIVSVLRNAGD